MNKYSLLIIIIITTSIYPQSTPIDSLKTRIIYLENSTKAIVHKNDSLISVNTKLADKVDYDAKLLERYNTFNNILMWGAGGLLALFGVLVPTIGYVLVYRSTKQDRAEAQTHLEESRGLLNSIRNEMDGLFRKYQRNSRNELIDSVLTSLEEKDEANTINNIAYLGTLRHEGFNNGQISRIITLFKRGGHIDAFGNNFLLDSLLFTDNAFTDELFFEIISNEKYYEHYFRNAIIYFGKYNKVKYLDDIAKTIVKANFIIPAIQGLESYTLFTKNLLNNDYLATNMTIHEINYAISLENSPWFCNRVDFFNTKFYEKYKEKKPNLDISNKQ